MTEGKDEVGFVATDTTDKQSLSGDCLALITHDLKAPLSNISGFATVLGQETFGPLNTKQKEYVKVIQECSRHLLELTDDLLDWSKIEGGNEDLVYEHISIQEIVESSCCMVEYAANHKKLHVAVDNTYPSGHFFADKKRMYQIIVNLLSNSVKYTDFGAILLSIRKCESYIRFAVQDTGRGIPVEEQPFLFVPYQRYNSSENREGTGLGLVLVKRFVELHKGWLSMQSTPGVGTKITVGIPIHVVPPVPRQLPIPLPFPLPNLGDESEPIY